MINVQSKLGFTILEVLLAVSIIGFLTGLVAFSYSTISKSSRDSRRKSDFQQISQGLESFRGNSIVSSYPNSLNELVPSYVSVLPKDPKTSTQYSYSTSPSLCTDVAPTPPNAPAPCTSYTLTTTLETNNQTYSCTNGGCN